MLHRVTEKGQARVLWGTSDHNLLRHSMEVGRQRCSSQKNTINQQYSSKHTSSHCQCHDKFLSSCFLWFGVWILERVVWFLLTYLQIFTLLYDKCYLSIKKVPDNFPGIEVICNPKLLNIFSLGRRISMLLYLVPCCCERNRLDAPKHRILLAEL